jgi:2-polyprenyl-3-methyl-5-hydroxy-6-metoxy-1,4-benzoquinol methylase
MREATGRAVLRTNARPRCVVCGSEGRQLYEGVPDLMLGIAGRWRVVRCLGPECGTLWLDPAPLQEDLPNAYQNYLTHDSGRPLLGVARRRDRVRAAVLAQWLGYPAKVTVLDRLLARVAGWIPPLRQSVQREVMFVPYRPGGRLLEIGCGNGRQLERLAQAGWQVQGVDFDPRAVQTARSLGLPVALGDLAAQGFAAESFDAIVSSHVIEHVPDPVALLRECRRLLKPDGILVVMTPNAEAFGHRLYSAAWVGLDPPRHLYVFSAWALVRMARQASLEPTALHSRWIAAAGWFLASRMRARAAVEGSFTALPGPEMRFPLRYWLLAALEALSCALGRPWGEELVLVARPAAVEPDSEPRGCRGHGQRAETAAQRVDNRPCDVA